MVTLRPGRFDVAAVRLSVERALSRPLSVGLAICAAFAAGQVRAEDSAYHRCSPSLQRAYADKPASTLNPSPFVMPREPAIKGVRQGAVDLLVTLRRDGRVSRVCVLDSAPLGVFESVTVEAVAKWRYPAAQVAKLPKRRMKVHVGFQMK
jgi:TonB family protein